MRSHVQSSATGAADQALAARYPELRARVVELESSLRQARLPGRSRTALRTLHQETDRAYRDAVLAARAAYRLAVGPVDGVTRVRFLAATRSPAARRWAHEIDVLVTAWVAQGLQAGDDLGVRPPTVVRVGNRAALGPAIPGIVFGSRAAETSGMWEPRIGVDMLDTVDHGPATGRPRLAARPEEGTTPVVAA